MDSDGREVPTFKPGNHFARKQLRESGGKGWVVPETIRSTCEPWKPSWGDQMQFGGMGNREATDDFSLQLILSAWDR